jgi:two-component system invasion response regulator UvrY
MIRILVADDHTVVREGVKRILADTPDLVIAGEANHGQEVLAKAEAEAWDLVLLDISMPGRNGLEVLQQLHILRPTLPVLVFSMHPENQYALRAFRAGAVGYLTKDSLPEELVTAVRKVIQGGRYVSAAMAEYLVAELGYDSTAPLHAALSNREYQVLCLLASGKTVTETARELSLSVKTVSTHRSRILQKMRMKTNAELIHYAIRHRLVD